MGINHTIFHSVIRGFWKEAKEQYIYSGYPHCPFLPYTFGRYGLASPKIFYIGQDTYWWCDKYLPDMIRQFNIEDYDSFLGMYDKTEIIDDEGIVTVPRLRQWGNGAGIFWSVVQSLHLLIRTGVYHSHTDDYTENDFEILEEIGYGNLQAIEQRSSLRNEGISMKDKTAYSKLKSISEQKLDKLKFILEAYNPDIIFVLAWKDYDSWFEGVENKWLEELYIDGERAVYRLNNGKKVIWSAHPRRMLLRGYNKKELVHFLADSLK